MEQKTPSGAAEEAAGSFPAGWEELLKELGEALSGYTGRTEDLLAEHPLASVLAAFVLGVAVGRMMGRT